MGSEMCIRDRASPSPVIFLDCGATGSVITASSAHSTITASPSSPCPSVTAATSTDKPLQDCGVDTAGTLAQALGLEEDESEEHAA